MRWKVDLKYGYASFNESDKEKAWDLFHDEGIRIRKCKDIMDDEGIVVEGLPIYEDRTIPFHYFLN